jgi:hypothetical protein
MKERVKMFWLLFKTAYRKWPDFSIGYNKDTVSFGLTNQTFKTDAFNSNVMSDFFQVLTFN